MSRLYVTVAVLLTTTTAASCMLQGIMSRLYETAAVLVLVAVVIYGLVRVVSALLYSHTGGYSSMQEASSMFFCCISL